MISKPIQNIRQDKDKPLIVILNVSFSTTTIDIPTGGRFTENSLWHDLQGNGEVPVTRNATR